MGDANLQNCNNYLHCNGILNDILDKALEIALDDKKLILDAANNMNNIDKMEDEVTSRKLGIIIEDFNRFNLNDDHEAKMVSSPLETTPCKMNVVDIPSKCVEKKLRVTDLVMNSKKVLNNLLDEKERKKQGEWEENNEHVIQVIELQNKQTGVTSTDISLPTEADESYMLRVPDDSTMERIDLNGGEGDDGKVEQIKKEISIKDSLGEKSSDGKKKKWSFNFKFCWLKKKSSKQLKSSPTSPIEK